MSGADRLIGAGLAAGIAVGAAAAAAALYGRYFVLPGFLTGPRICMTEARGCAALFRSPRAALLGVPNSLLALLFYGLLGAGLASGWPEGWLLAGTSAALLMSVRLGVSLMRQGLECRVCWTGHFANLLIWSALLARTWG